MHRSINSKDVEEYSGDARPRDIELNKEEDVEYRSGSLYTSSGATHLRIFATQKRRHSPKMNDNLTDSNILTVNGSYRLDRINCYTLSSKEMLQRKRRTTDSANMVESTLSAAIDKREHLLILIFILNFTITGSIAREHLEHLRQQLPSPPLALKELHEDPQITYLGQ